MRVPREAFGPVLVEAVHRHPSWYHQIELAPGLVTPGSHHSAAALRDLDALGLPEDCRGRRVLDIGCRDGFFAFTLEARGAEVVGIDYADPDATGFALASRALGSSVRYETMNVYDLDPTLLGRFDLVLFLGVLYHLRNPLLALDRIRAVAEPEALLFVETQVASDPVLLHHTSPLWEFFPRDTLAGDGSNMWAPNLAGLRAVLEESLFRVERIESGGVRAVARGLAVSDRDLSYFRDLDYSRGTWGRRQRPDS